MNTSSSVGLDTTPWYRQFWPWFIMALPATAVVAGLYTVYVAVIHKDSVVRDDWYQDGRAINVDIARDQAAQAAKLKADLRFDALTGELDVQIQGHAASLPETLTLTLTHATLSQRDQALTLRRQPDGHHRGALQRELQGDFDIELGDRQWRLTSNARFPRASLHLEAN